MSMELIEELLADAEERMQKSVEATRNELATVRTGRASPHLLDRLTVDNRHQAFCHGTTSSTLFVPLYMWVCGPHA